MRVRSASRFWRHAAASVALPVVVAGFFYAVTVYSTGTKVGRSGDPAALIVPGDQFVAPDLLPPDAHVYADSTGYDGQFFFYLSQDPLLTGEVADRDDEQSPHLDHIAYRYQRILLPALGWLSSWGEPRVLEWTLPLINVVAVLGTGFLLARFLSSRGRSPWLSLVFMVSLGVVAGVANNLSDPLAASLFVAGAVWWLEGRTGLSVAVLAACLLAREVYLLPVAAIFLLELLRDRRQALPWLVPLVVFGAWQLYLRVALETPVTPASVERPSIVPLEGAIRKAGEILRDSWLDSVNWELAFVALLLLLPLFFGVRSLDLLGRMRRTRRFPSREELLPAVGLASVLLVPFLTVALWGFIPSYARYAAPAAGILVLHYAVTRDTAARYLMIALMVLSLTNPAVALLPVAHSTAPVVP